MTGGLTLVGVGPGDPSLLTLAAVEAIRRAQVVAYPIGRPGADSMAARIAATWIRSDHQRLPLLFPMVEAAEPRRTAWRSAAQQLQARAIRSGQQVALLCEGDASLFASCSYVLLAIRQAVARLSHHRHSWNHLMLRCSCCGPLASHALQQDQLLVRPCPDTPEELERGSRHRRCNWPGSRTAEAGTSLELGSTPAEAARTAASISLC